jgi:hypothetical protein
MTRFVFCFSVGLILLLFTSGTACAGVVLGIDDARSLPDGTEDPMVYLVGQAPYGFLSPSVTLDSELAQISGAYASDWTGNSASVAFNFYEPWDVSQFSDLLVINFNRLDGVFVQADISFVSDGATSGPTFSPYPDGPNTFNLVETGDFMQLDAYIQAVGGPADFSLSVRSDSPEPSTLALTAAGLLGGFLGLRRRKRR